MSLKLPIVSIIGRQNVGKSTLFNALTKQKNSIVDPYPGLTRDIITYKITHNEISFILADTPGLDLPKSAKLSNPIIENAKEHLNRANLIILLLENPNLEKFDLDLVDFTRKISIPTILAINKMDQEKDLDNMDNFFELGLSDLLPISAQNRFNLSLLLDKIINLLPTKKSSQPEVDLKISIVGRANSGKSTLLNSFLGYNRSVVSNIPGTTRDSVDEDFKFQKHLIRIIDTAGIKKKSRINDKIEFYSFTRTIKAIKKSDVVIHLLDAELGLTETDKKISDEIHKAKKPIIIAVNKWDKIKKETQTFKNYKEKIIFRLYIADDFPIISISAKDKLRIHKLLETAVILKEKSHLKISTPRINKIIGSFYHKKAIPQLGEKIKIYYATQINSAPLVIKMFVNDPLKFKKDIIRYLEKNLKKELDLYGIPLILELEGKKNYSKIKT